MATPTVKIVGLRSMDNPAVREEMRMQAEIADIYRMLEEHADRTLARILTPPHAGQRHG